MRRAAFLQRRAASLRAHLCFWHPAAVSRPKRELAPLALQQGDSERVQNVLMLLVGQHKLGFWLRAQFGLGSPPDLFEFTRPAATCLLVVFSARAPRDESSEPAQCTSPRCTFGLVAQQKGRRGRRLVQYTLKAHTFATAQGCFSLTALKASCVSLLLQSLRCHLAQLGAATRARWLQEHLDE